MDSKIINLFFIEKNNISEVTIKSIAEKIDIKVLEMSKIKNLMHLKLRISNTISTEKLNDFISVVQNFV